MYVHDMKRSNFSSLPCNHIFSVSPFKTNTFLTVESENGHLLISIYCYERQRHSLYFFLSIRKSCTFNPVYFTSIMIYHLSSATQLYSIVLSVSWILIMGGWMDTWYPCQLDKWISDIPRPIQHGYHTHDIFMILLYWCTLLMLFMNYSY